MKSPYDVLRTITSSRLRLDILRSLESPMRLSDLRRVVDSNAPNTSAKARDLQRLNLIKRDNGDYEITRMGELVRKRVLMLLDTLTVLYEHGDFWSRIIDSLPDEIIEMIHEFRDARLIANDRKNLERVKHEISERIKQARGMLFVVMPANCRDMLKAVEKVSGRMETRLVTLRDRPDLHYGLVVADNFAILFTEMLDMALVKDGKIDAGMPHLEVIK